MGTFAFSCLSACAWIGVGEAGTSNPGFPGPGLEAENAKPELDMSERN